MSKVWLVTGPPGVGKSTLISRVVFRLKGTGVMVGGCLTSEMREKGVRVGFAVVNLTDGGRGELASATSHLGPRVGRYRVNLKDLASVGAAGLQRASESSEVIVIDEVGPMELVSPEFRRALKACIESGKPILAVVHPRLDDDLLTELKEKAEEIVTLSLDNQDSVGDYIAAKILAAVGGPKTS